MIFKNVEVFTYSSRLLTLYKNEKLSLSHNRVDANIINVVSFELKQQNVSQP